MNRRLLMDDESPEAQRRDPEGGAEQQIPGAPASRPAPLEQPTHPDEPPPPKSDQEGPQPLTPTGAQGAEDISATGQQGAWLTTAQGVRLYETDHSLRAGD